jgi:hypothetical protein
MEFSISESNGTTYKGTKLKIKNTIFSVVIAEGKSNYINIRKETANPFKTMGKYFANFDEAVANYKGAEMKLQLLKLELGL